MAMSWLDLRLPPSRDHHVRRVVALVFDDDFPKLCDRIGVLTIRLDLARCYRSLAKASRSLSKLHPLIIGRNVTMSISDNTLNGWPSETQSGVALTYDHEARFVVLC